jgi:hypothetical protein
MSGTPLFVANAEAFTSQRFTGRLGSACVLVADRAPVELAEAFPLGPPSARSATFLPGRTSERRNAGAATQRKSSCCPRRAHCASVPIGAVASLRLPCGQ